jgi:hypothetical protein
VTRATPILALAALACLLAGCGGSKAPSSYTKAKTRVCLGKQNVPVVPATDFVASTATGGSLKARLADNFVTIAFGLTLSDANNIEEAYTRFAGKNVGVTDVLRQQANAVMLWHAHPSDADVALITGCLK